MDNPWVRLVGRALVAGLGVFFTTLQVADDPFDKAVLLGACWAAIQGATEVVTPLNVRVGPFKKPT